MSLKNKILAVGFATAFCLPVLGYADSLIAANIKNDTNFPVQFQYQDNQCAYNYERNTFSIEPKETKRIIFNSDEGGRCGGSYKQRLTYLVYKFEVGSARKGSGVVSINVKKGTHTKVELLESDLSNVSTAVGVIEGVPTYLILGG